MGRPRKWTPETVLASIRHFVATQHRVPYGTDFYHGCNGLPHTATVRQHFRNEAEAVRVAGFEPHVPHVTTQRHVWRRMVRPHRAVNMAERTQAQKDEMRRFWNQGLDDREESP